MAYIFLKDAHSVIRWFVILAAAWALFQVWCGLLRNSAWTKRAKLAGLVFTSILNLQLLVGIALYLASPIVQSALKNMAMTMRTSSIRFVAIEHPFMMLLAVIIAQVGYSISKRAGTDRSRFLKATIAYSVAVVLILIAIPWPFLPYGRPLLPGMPG